MPSLDLNSATALSSASDYRVAVFGSRQHLGYLYARTCRSLQLAGVPAERIIALTDDAMETSALQALLENNHPTWFIQAGSWSSPAAILAGYGFELPPPSASLRPLCALGSTMATKDSGGNRDISTPRWNEILNLSGGDFDSANIQESSWPQIHSCYLAPNLLPELLCHVAQGTSLNDSLRKIARSSSTRTIHWQGIDVHFDPRLRVAQIITSLQRGGAERIAIDLHNNLSRHQHESLLISLGTPGRQSFDAPPGTVDISRAAFTKEERLKICKQRCQLFAADLIHAHLLRNADLATLAKTNIPIVSTVHNTKSGWPDPLGELSPEIVKLLIACSLAVEQELTTTVQGIPVRTVWNGIQPIRSPKAAKKDENEIVLVAIANPRHQKRLERLPYVAASLQRLFYAQGIARNVRLLIAGEASRDNEQARESVDRLDEAINASGMDSQVELLGPISDVGTLLSQADVLLSAAAHEGLSLAHLEALSANVPVVATDVGGTREIAARCPGLKLVSAEASSDEFASAVLDVISSKHPPYQETIERHFSSVVMTQAYSRMYHRTLSSRSRTSDSGLLLVINNFSTGGAQTSAKRLLTGFHSRGINVRAAVLQESSQYPTPGHQALLAEGIDVLALPCAGKIDPLAAIQPLLQSIDIQTPKAIVFWNAISEYKLLIADSVWGIPIYDVSPGEMLYSSFDRYWQRPRPGLPYSNARDYGRRLSGVVVKYSAERPAAQEYFGTSVHVVPNGVTLKPHAQANLSKPKILIGTVARISPQKKLEELIEAIRSVHHQLPPYCVQIVGGPEQGSEEYALNLKEQSKGLCIEWIGERTNPSEILSTWDMFVLIAEPAGCPNAGLEAMSHGLAMIATNAGGASEQVESGVNGCLVPRGDVAQLAQAIQRLAYDSELRCRYGSASHQRAATRFSVERMLDDYEQIFRLKE